MVDVAAELVRNIRRRHDLPPRPTAARLVAVITAYGCGVRTHPDLTTLGAYLPHPYPLICLRRGAPLRVLAHEWAHHLALELPEPPPVHVYPRDPEDEPIANRFALLITGEAAAQEPRPRRPREWPKPQPMTPRQWFESEMLCYSLDFGPEIIAFGQRLVGIVETMEDAREAAAVAWEAFDGP